MYTLHTQCSFKCSMSLSMIMDYNFSYQAQVESSETVLAISLLMVRTPFLVIQWEENWQWTILDIYEA